MEIKKCTKCGEIKTIDSYYTKKTEKRYNSWCKKCVYEKQKNRWKDRKRKAISLKGGKCCRCGYDKCLASLDFHHINSENKKYEWSQLRQLPWNEIIKELKKCILVCKNCHGEIHWMKYGNNIFEDMGNSNSLLNKKNLILKETGICPNCKKKVYGTRFCSTKCVALSKRKVSRPSKKILKKLIENTSWCAIGRKYRVSDNSVRKWAKNYNLL